MQLMLNRFYRFLDQPIFMRARIVLVLLVIPLGLNVLFPLWEIGMTAPQYPEGLEMHVYAHKLGGGHGGHDIEEINRLNHYIGMRPIEQDSIVELDWLPFAFGLLMILTLRAAAIGNIRSLIDLFVLTGYISLFGFGRFVYMLYQYGHDLDPKAPMNVDPFMPVVLGTKQIANFSTHSYPRGGSYLLAVFVLGLAGLVAWHLIVGRIRAVRSKRGAEEARAAAAEASEERPDAAE